MRFKYDPDEFVLSVYVTQDEFQLAGSPDKKEYRVAIKEFDNHDDIHKFITEYTKFVKDIVGSIYPDEKIKDVVVFSTLSRMGFSWTSLLDGDNHYQSPNYLDAVLSYGVNEIRTARKSKTDMPSTIMDVLADDDVAKLSLARTLLNSIESASVWRARPKSDKAKVKTDAHIKKLKNKINSFEKKYGFSSEEMYKFYNDDELPDPEMESWKNAYQQYKIAQMSIDKESLIKELVDKWRKSFD